MYTSIYYIIHAHTHTHTHIRSYRYTYMQEQGVKELLMSPSLQAGCSGARNIADNLSDLRAQVFFVRMYRALLMYMEASFVDP